MATTYDDCMSTRIRCGDATVRERALADAAPQLWKVCKRLRLCLRNPDMYGGVTTDEALADADAVLSSLR